MARKKTEKPLKEEKLKLTVNSRVSASLYDLLRSLEADIAGREYLKAEILKAVAFADIRADLEATALKIVNAIGESLRLHLRKCEDWELGPDVRALLSSLDLLAHPDMHPDLTALVIKSYNKPQAARAVARPALRLVK